MEALQLLTSLGMIIVTTCLPRSATGACFRCLFSIWELTGFAQLSGLELADMRSSDIAASGAWLPASPSAPESPHEVPPHAKFIRSASGACRTRMSQCDTPLSLTCPS